MKQSVNMYDFERAFKNFERDNFSYDGLKALFEYLEEYEEDTGEDTLSLHDALPISLQRKTKNSLYEYNGWVTENYVVFDADENKPEQIKRPRLNHCEHCNESWEGSHYCKVLNSPERIKAREQKARERRRIRLSGNILEIPIETEEEII